MPGHILVRSLESTGVRRLENQFLRPYRWIIAFALGGMLVQSLCVLPIPLLQGWVLDAILASAAAGESDRADALAMIVTAFLGSAACYALRTLLAWKVGVTMNRVSLEVVRALTDAMHRKLQRLPVAYFDREPTGRVMSRITSDVGSLLIFLNSASLQLVSDLVLAAGIAGTLLLVQWQLAVVCLGAAPFYALNHLFFKTRLRNLAGGLQNQIAMLYGLLSERISAVRLVRSFAQESAEIAELDRLLEHNRSLSWSVARLGAWQGAAAIAISGLATVLTLYVGACLTKSGAMSIGELLAFYTLAGLLYNPVVRLAQFQGTMAATVVAANRIADVLQEPETLMDRADARPIKSARGALAFKNVSFSYRLDGPLVLDGIDLEIEPGMKIGILGASGAGKSTLLALAPRLYEVGGGRGVVRVDGQDVRDLRLTDLRRTVALVPQQAMLFEGTLRFNLTYARPNAPPALLERVLNVAELTDWIASLPRGLDTPVSEGGRSLSGGQRQRLALARTLLVEPAILLLDQCTSALDAETEARVWAALNEFIAGRTRLVVSQKISAVRDADRIIVLHGGKIVEQGSHEELLRRKGVYASITALPLKKGPGGYQGPEPLVRALA